MGGGGGGDGGAADRISDENQKAALRREVNALYDTPEAQQRFASEETQLSDALRGFYSDDLKRGYEEAERGLRFGAANTGNVGGSAYADQVAKLNEKNQIGGTRIEEAVRRAINNLRGGREDTRMRSINLVNSGTGTDAVASAATGLRQALSASNAANREDIVSGLFDNLAFVKSGYDAQQRNAAQNDLYRKARSFFSTQPSNNGAIVDTEY
jgi:hypothetical protein